MPTTPLLILLLTVATYAQTSLQDERDGKTYKTVKIGEQTWMAENLNYNAEGSKCYENKQENCAKYGRLYNWQTAMKSCPAGWHLPSEEEWIVLIETAGGKEKAGKKLKAKEGWKRRCCNTSNGTDDYGFSALPTGEFFFPKMDQFMDAHDSARGNYAAWWSATWMGVDTIFRSAYTPTINDENHRFYNADAFHDEFNGIKKFIPVRCIKN